MKQTAIQELISEFQDLKKTKLYEKSFKAIDDCIDLAYSKIETENQQIIDAHVAGHNAPSSTIKNFFLTIHTSTSINNLLLFHF